MPETNVSAQEAIDDFLDRMIEDKGEVLTPEERLMRRKELKERLDGMVDEEMIAAVPDDKIIELDERMREGMTAEQVEAFLLEAGADFDQAAIAALDRLRDEYLGLNGTTTMTNLEGEEK